MTSSSPFWEGRSVLVTGATGLLGSWMVPALLRRGANVVALVHRSATGRVHIDDSALERIQNVIGSLTDDGLVEQAIADHGVKTIFHLGAQALVDVAKKDPVGTLETNVRGTWLLLDAARQTGVEQVLVASSVKAYGQSPHLPYREGFPLLGRYPYDVSKSCADLITSMYAQTFGTPTVAVRCGNLFGGGDLNFNRLIPGVILATLKGERFVIRSDGQFIRDFLYVEDAAEAYLCLAEKLATESSLIGDAFNFSLGLRLTMLDLVHRILEMMGRPDLTPVVQNVASAEVREETLDPSKAREVLGWAPQFGMEEGLRRTIAWYSAAYPQKDTVNLEAAAAHRR
jgi:CDP-glucose 4,6-dehydratase